jgi:hypothetical protein
MRLERERIRRELGPPYVDGMGLVFGLAILGLIVLVQWAVKDPVFMGKAGLLVLAGPAIALWCIARIISLPFRRPALKRELQLLESVDTLAEARVLRISRNS